MERHDILPLVLAALATVGTAQAETPIPSRLPGQADLFCETLGNDPEFDNKETVVGFSAEEKPHDYRTALKLKVQRALDVSFDDIFNAKIVCTYDRTIDGEDAVQQVPSDVTFGIPRKEFAKKLKETSLKKGTLSPSVAARVEFTGSARAQDKNPNQDILYRSTLYVHQDPADGKLNDKVKAMEGCVTSNYCIPSPGTDMTIFNEEYQSKTQKRFDHAIAQGSDFLRQRGIKQQTYGRGKRR